MTSLDLLDTQRLIQSHFRSFETFKPQGHIISYTINMQCSLFFFVESQALCALVLTGLQGLQVEQHEPYTQFLPRPGIKCTLPKQKRAKILLSQYLYCNAHSCIFAFFSLILGSDVYKAFYGHRSKNISKYEKFVLKNAFILKLFLLLWRMQKWGKISICTQEIQLCQRVFKNTLWQS